MKFLVKCLAALFVLVALGAAALGIYLAVNGQGALPVLLGKAQAAEDRAEALLDAVLQQRYEQAQEMFLGSVELRMEPPQQDALERMLWQVYGESLEFSPVGEVYATETGVARDYAVRHLDWKAALVPLSQRAQQLMQQRIAQAENMEEIYDQDYAYRAELVAEVLEEAAAELLQEDLPYVEGSFTVRMVYQDGLWWIVPEQALLEAITGGLTE